MDISGLISCPKTLVTDYPSVPRNIPAEQGPPYE